MKFTFMLIRYILFHIGFYTPLDYSDRYSPCNDQERIIILSKENTKNEIVSKLLISIIITITIGYLVFLVEIGFIGNIILVILPFILMAYIINAGLMMTSIYFDGNEYFLEKLSYGNFHVKKFDKDRFQINFIAETNELLIKYDEEILIRKTIYKEKIETIRDNEHFTS